MCGTDAISTGCELLKTWMKMQLATFWTTINRVGFDLRCLFLKNCSSKIQILLACHFPLVRSIKWLIWSRFLQVEFVIYLTFTARSALRIDMFFNFFDASVFVPVRFPLVFSTHHAFRVYSIEAEKILGIPAFPFQEMVQSYSSYIQTKSKLTVNQNFYTK